MSHVLNYYNPVHFSMTDNGLKISNTVRWMIGAFWVGITIVAAAHCYLYTFVGSEAPISFLKSLYFAAIRWCSWIVVTPLALELACRWYRHEISLQSKIRQYLTVSMASGAVVSFIYTVTDPLIWVNENTGTLVYYDTLLKELPISFFTLGAVIYVCFSYLNGMEAATSQGEEQRDHVDHIFINGHDQAAKIAITDIVHVRAAGNYVYIHTMQDTLMHRITMKQLTDLLDSKSFIRVHKSHIINRCYVESVKSGQYGDYQLTLKSEDTVTMSRYYAQKIREKFSQPIKQVLLAVV